MVLRRIFGPNRDEVTGDCRKIHNEELNELYSSPNVVWVIKSSRMRWAGHNRAYMWRGDVYRGFWWGNLNERDQLEDPSLDQRVVLSWNFRNLDVGAWTGSKWLRIGTGGGHL
jgi:hypothetical protein